VDFWRPLFLPPDTLGNLAWELHYGWSNNVFFKRANAYLSVLEEYITLQNPEDLEERYVYMSRTIRLYMIRKIDANPGESFGSQVK